MTKMEFILSLQERLSNLPQEDVAEHLAFYVEMIEDRMEDGISEEEAVSAVGTVDKIAMQIVDDIPLAKIAKKKIMPKRRFRVWEVVLLALGFPVWFSLAVALLSVVLAVYASLWAVIVSLWSGFVSLCACAIGGIVMGVVYICLRNDFLGLAYIGAGAVLAGFAILMFYGCKAATKGLLWLTKKTVLGIKKGFIKKEEA